MYTNYGLVKHAQNALKLKTKYMWGGILRPITDSYVNQLAKMYGATQYSSSRVAMLKALPDGYYGVDCVGLIKSYYWSGKANGGTGSPKYMGNTDVNAHGMYNAAKIKGKIGTIPEIPGLVVYCKSSPHVGVYIGNGYVIESTLGSRGDGVVKTKLSAFKWEYWCQCPYIEYFTESTNTGLKVGDKVKVSTSCKTTYEGGKLSAKYVANGTSVFDVIEIKNDRVVIGKGTVVTAAVKKTYLTKV